MSFLLNNICVLSVFIAYYHFNFIIFVEISELNIKNEDAKIRLQNLQNTKIFGGNNLL